MFVGISHNNIVWWFFSRW